MTIDDGAVAVEGIGGGGTTTGFSSFTDEGSTSMGALQTTRRGRRGGTSLSLGGKGGGR